MPGSITRVLLVDDNERWYSFYRKVIGKRPNLQIIGHVSDGLEAVEQAQELQPDLILLDIGLPALNGLEAARRIREVSPASKVLFVSDNSSPDIAEEALSTGAGGYVVKSNAATELLPAIEAVLRGKRFVSAGLAAHNFVTSNRGISRGGRPTDPNPYLRLVGSESIPEFLASVMAATAADFGAIQLYDSANHVLKIVAQHGFETDFLDYCNTAGLEADSACNQSMEARTRIVVKDVASDPVFSSDFKGLLLRANVRSIQATPLIDSSGKLVGIVSTHYSHPNPSPDALKHVDDLATSFLAEINE